MKEKTISRKAVFQGRLIKVEVLKVQVGTGVRSTREIVRHPGATAILAQLPDERFVLVRQYRKAVEKEMLEIVAGTLTPGEKPRRCARRELREETGYTASSLIPLGVIFPSPGYVEEKIHLYFARLRPVQGSRCLDDDEKLNVLRLTASQIETAIRKGRVQDAKTLAAWMFYKLKVLRGKQ